MVTVPGYRIEELLSWGSQGDVFRGVDATGVTVALKVVTSDRLEGDPQALQRLHREARLLAALDSPHVVKVRELVQASGWSCLVLEFLAGQRLDTALRGRAGLGGEAPSTASASTIRVPAAEQVVSPRPAAVLAAATPACLRTPEHVAWALDVALQLTAGVAEMHRIRLVHRDIKPQNAMLVDGRVVLIDFGFARRDGVTTMTQAGTAIGTLAYMSPELLAGRPADERSDVHALGASIHQLLTGSPPFGADAPSIRAMAWRGRAHDVRKSNPAVGAALATVVARCLEPDARDRYADAGAVLADLQRVQRGEAVRLPFSLARLYRHQRRNLQRIAAVSGVGAALALVLALRGDEGLDGVAASILVAIDAEPEGVPEPWQSCRDEDRPGVVLALNNRLAGDAQRATAVAVRLQLGMLLLQPRANHAVALVPSTGSDQPPSLSLDEFVTTDAPCGLLVRPGRAWFLMMSLDPKHWWAPDDPFCLQLLVQVDAVRPPLAARSFGVLPSSLFNRTWVEMVPFAAGDQPVCDVDGRIVRFRVEQPFATGLMETAEAPVANFRRVIAQHPGSRAELESWLRHPDEPPEVAGQLWSVWLATKDQAHGRLPARMSFWEAHRFASWHGCRLPTHLEWRVAACGGDRRLGTTADRVVPGGFVAVDERETWDVTPRGLLHANSNALEWTLEPRTAPQGAMLAAPGHLTMTNDAGRRVLFAWRDLPTGEVPEEPHGVRLYRTVQRGAGRR